MTLSNIQYVTLQNPMITSNGYYIDSMFHGEDVNPYPISDFGAGMSGVNSGIYLTKRNVYWGLYSPELDYVSYDKNEIAGFETFSGFNIKLYEVTGGLNHISSRIQSGNKVFITGVTGSENFLEFELYKDNGSEVVKLVSHNKSGYLSMSGNERLFEVEAVSVDRFNNRNTGVAIINNNPPIVETNSNSDSYTGISGGKFFIDFNILNSDTNKAEVYNFSGLSQYGDFNFTEQEILQKQYSKQDFDGGYFNNSSGRGHVDLIPSQESYIGIRASDSIGFGQFTSITDPILFEPKIFDATGYRIEEGGKVFYEINGNFDERNPLFSGSYLLRSDGDVYKYFSGGTSEIYAGSGYLQKNHSKPTNFNSDTAFSLEKDSTLSFISGFRQSGKHWDNNSIYSSGNKYAILNGENGSIKPYSLSDITGFRKEISESYSDFHQSSAEKIGCFTMPINEPNSLDIRMETGAGLTNVTYEEAQTLLRDQERMLAVFMYEEQLSKAKDIISSSPYNVKFGHIGLKKEKTNIYKNSPSGQSFHSEGMEFSTEAKQYNYDELLGTGTLLSTAGGNYELINQTLMENDWCWINNSGNQIYRVAGSGEAGRDFYLDASLEYSGNHCHSLEDIRASIPVVRMSGSGITYNQQDVVFNFKGLPDFYKKGNGYGFQGTIHGYQIYTGSSSPVLLEKEYLADESFGSVSQEEVSYSLSDTTNAAPSFIRFLPFDRIGSGIATQSFQTSFTQKIGIGQFGVKNLDYEYDCKRNWTEVDFPLSFGGGQSPQINFNIYYTGVYSGKNTIKFIGAMLSGFDTSKTTFVFSDLIPASGYALSWNAQVGKGFSSGTIGELEQIATSVQFFDDVGESLIIRDQESQVYSPAEQLWQTGGQDISPLEVPLEPFNESSQFFATGDGESIVIF